MNDTLFWYALLGRKGFRIAAGVFILILIVAYLYTEVTRLYKKSVGNTEGGDPAKRYNTLGLFTVVLFSIIGVPSFLIGALLLLFNIAAKDTSLLFITIPLILIGGFIIFCLIKNGYNSRKNKAFSRVPINNLEENR